MTEIILDNNFFECPICLELFDDTCKMLPCQHTFHKSCLQKIFSIGECLECPQCRQTVSEDIEVLPRNYFLHSILEKMKTKSEKSQDHESLQLHFVIETSKTEAQIRARERYLLSQKEKVEYELMLLKSAKENANKNSTEVSSAASSSFSTYTTESGTKENNCSNSNSFYSCRSEEIGTDLIDEMCSLNLTNLFEESACKSESQSINELPHSLEKQVIDGFKVLNTFVTNRALAEKLLEIVKVVDSQKNFNNIDLMYLIDYDDLIKSYLAVLNDQSWENNVELNDDRSRSDVTGMNSAMAACSSISKTDEVSSLTNFSPLVVPTSIGVFDSRPYDLPVGSSACDSNLRSNYNTYSFSDDDRNLTYALELSRQFMLANNPDDVIEKVIQKSKIAFIVDQQRKIFSSIREKVELQIALVMSEI